MATQITTYEELILHYPQPVFVRNPNDSGVYSPNIKEIGYWLKECRNCKIAIFGFSKTGMIDLIDCDTFNSATFYTDIPDDFDGWIMHEENSLDEYNRLKGDFKPTLKVVFCPDGTVVSDFKSAEFVDTIISEFNRDCINREIRVGTEKVFDIFVLRTMQEKLDATHVEFYIENVQIPFDRHLGLDDADIDYDYKKIDRSKIVNEILRIGYANMRADRQRKDNGVNG